MEYYKLLQLKSEPFSNSPDPEYFFLSSRHQECLQKLELALRLKRGLNVVMGEVGTGKTTLCRELIRRFSAEPDIETHLILDPSFATTEDFLRLLYAMLLQKDAADAMPSLALKEHIQHALLVKGVDQQRTVVLIIDEGQKISSACIEILRELLNFETNQFKLLQIVIFAQLEFRDILEDKANFADRINLLHYLAPMDFKDTRRMIHHRLKLSSTTARPAAFFTLPALWAIYRSTRGYPRKIIHLCHQSMLTMLIQNRTRAGWSLIRSCKQRLIPKRTWPGRIIPLGVAAVLVLLLVTFLPKYLFRTATSSVTPAFKIQPPPQADTAAPVTPMPPVQAAMEITPLPVKPAAPVAAPRPDPPLMLGDLSVKPGDTLIRLIRLVYGCAEQRCVHSVVAANPGIQNPDSIDLKDLVSFPLVVFQWDEKHLKKHRVILKEVETLNAARDILTGTSRVVQMPLRLFCYWTPEQGARFQLALATVFDSLSSAQESLKALPEDLAAQASIRSGWPEGALLLSSPPMERPTEYRFNG